MNSSAVREKDDLFDLLEDLARKYPQRSYAVATGIDGGEVLMIADGADTQCEIYLPTLVRGVVCSRAADVLRVDAKKRIDLQHDVENYNRLVRDFEVRAQFAKKIHDNTMAYLEAFQTAGYAPPFGVSPGLVRWAVKSSAASAPLPVEEASLSIELSGKAELFTLGQPAVVFDSPSSVSEYPPELLPIRRRGIQE